MPPETGLILSVLMCGDVNKYVYLVTCNIVVFAKLNSNLNSNFSLSFELSLAFSISPNTHLAAYLYKVYVRVT